jgi:hypothetical protein
MKACLYLCLCVFSFSLGYSQSIYHKDTLTIYADSLNKEGAYKQAYLVRKQALQTQKKASKDYLAYLEAKYYHSKCCYFENESYNYHNPDKALN